MGCNLSMCSDPNELLFSQELPHIEVKDSELNKSTHPSIYTTQANREEAVDELRLTVRSLFKNRENYPEMETLLEVWISEVYLSMEEILVNKEDLKTHISLDHSNLTILHTVEGLRNFSFMKNFCTRAGQSALVPTLDLGRFETVQNSLVNLCPFSINFSLTLGKTPDCSIGIEKNLNTSQLDDFLAESEEKAFIHNWVEVSKNPTPTHIFYSCLRERKELSFYVFRGNKTENFRSGFALFEEFGTVFDKDLADILLNSRCEELKCGLEFIDGRVLGISLEVPTQPDQQRLTDILQCIDCTKKDFQKFARRNKLSRFAIKLQPDGFCLNLTSPVLK